MNERLGALLYISSGYKSRPPLKVVGEVAQIYGLDWGPEGIGANFLIDVNWDPAEGESFPWKNYLNYWDHKFFNDLPEFSTGPITLERICLKIFEYLQNKTQLKSLSLKIKQGDFQYAMTDFIIYPNVAWAKSIKFNSLHRHHNETLTIEENQQIFRKCSQVHGHEYFFTLETLGPIDGNTQVVMAHYQIEQWLQKKVFEPLHGIFLNDLIGNTSGETLLLYLKKQLSTVLPNHLKWKYFLKETKKNSFSLDS